MQIREEVIERIRQDNDIVDIISENVRLKKSGRNYVGLCPFHNDKSPSLSVSQDKQIYKCFSCGEAGNVITFVMKYKKLTFYEASKYLADKAGIPLELGNAKESQITKKKELLYKVNTEAARYYFYNLQRTSFAKEYFLKRGIREEVIKRFGLGYAQDRWHDLIMYLKKKGFNENLLLEAGLILKSEKKGNTYDRFRNRVMFPVFDVRGKVIGFGGRVLDDSKPKYLNSPETVVFHKGTNLYGLNFATKNKLEQDYIIIVEGYMDLISLHQHGITNTVASLGTALTINQARLLKRYVNKVIISYDADVAGQTATLRGLEILRHAGLDVKVLKVPQGKDPDEFVRNNGKDAFLRLVDNALPLIEYRIKKAAEGINLRDNNELVKYGEKFAEILADLNPIEKDVYIKKISEETSIKEQAIYDLLSQVMAKDQKENKILLFSQFTKALKKLALKLDKEKIQYCYLDGSISSAARIKLVEEFNNDKNKRVFLISLKAGGTGLNLTSANMVIHFDPWWNPSIEDQATDRAHRIGQKRDVEVIKLIAKETIEEKIVLLQEDKRNLINDVLTNELNDSEVFNLVTNSELINLLK